MKNNYSYEGKLTTRLRQWWLMLTAVMLLTLTVGLQSSNAQSITNYAFSASSGSFTQIAGTGGSTNIPAIQADFGTSPFMPIGFNFLYNGVSYSQFFAHSDGYIGFGATAAGTAANALNAGLTTSRPLLAPYWDDISGFGGVNPGIGTYATTGLPGSRVLTVEFLNWRIFWNGPNALSFQVKLYEASGVVEFIYRQEGIPTASTASVGITAAATGAGNFLSLSDVTAAPTVSSVTETTTINAIPATNQVYTFTPPVAPPAPTTLTFSAVTNNSMSLDWVDATGEIGYIVERSLDGINYVQVASLPANTITYAAAGLSAGTTYYWNVYSFNEGQKSTALNSNQNTLAGTLCGAYSVGPTGTYASLTAALADIRVNGLSCSVILELQAAYVSSVETFPLWTGNIGTLAGKTVTIRPELGATALSITSAHTYATITDSLTQYLTIDGRAGGAGASELTIANTAFTGTAMRIHQESSDNAFQYIVFRGVNNTTGNAVVFMGGSTVVGGNGNDNNLFNECDFRDGASFPNNCFMASGNTTGAVNDNNTISNCRIYNFYSAGAASIGINLIGLNTNWTISGNRLYQENARNYTTGNIHKGIVANNTLGYFTISNNIIGFANSSSTGTYTMAWATTAVANRFFGMDVNAALSPATTISGNTISNISIATNSTGTGSGAPFCGIWLNSGKADITNNTVGSMSGVDNILVRGTVTGGSATTANVIGVAQGAASNVATTVTGNNIGGLGFNGITAAFANSATVGATVCGIFNQGSTTLADAGATRLISGNTIGGSVAGSLRAGNANQNVLTMSANFSVLGILNTGSTRITISNNSIQNLYVPTRSSAGVVYGIQTTTGINTISGNTITSLSSNAKNVAAATTAHLNGINHTSTTVPVTDTEVNISGNTIYNLKMSADTGRVVVNGIAYTGTTTVGFNQLIQKNLIYDLNDLTTASDTAKHVFIGIGLYGGLPTVQNNMVQLGLGNSKSQDYYGIYKANTNINKFYHNSVYIGGDASVASGILQGTTYGFRRVNRPASGNDEIINNIFYNARTSAVGGLQYAIGLDSNINATSTKNVLFADFANGGRTGIRNLTVASSLTDWRTLTGLDLNSISEDPNYIAPAASTPDLHIQPSPAVTPVEGAGLAIAGPADDYDGQARAGLTPIDIGADAGDFDASGDFVSPLITNVSFSPSGAQCVSASRVVFADVTDGTGIDSVYINWSLNGVAQTPITMTVFSGNTYSGTIPASGASLVSFTVSAVDNSVNANLSTSASQSYLDEYLFAGLSAGADQTICPGTSTNLSVASPYLNSIVFSEISGFETGTGAGPIAPGISGSDYIELTNIGNQPVDISGWKLETTGIAGSYIIPAGNTVAAGGTFTIARTLGGAAIPGVYVNSTLPAQGSGTAQGFIISDLGGNISDVAAINSHNPVGLGSPAVTAAMWSGNVASSSGTAGIRRTAFSDSNTAADWTVASASNLTNWGAFNVGLGTIMVANISWSSGGTGSIENVTPVASPTEYIVTLDDGVCTATDTVVVDWFTTLPAPVGVDSMHCGNQQAKCDIFSVPGATAYNWYLTPTGGTPVQSSIDTNLLINVATTTTFYVAAFDGVCDGPRVAVTETVVQPDPIDIVSALGSSICLGEVDTLDVVQTGSTNTYLYTWSGDGVGTLNVNSGAQVISTPIAGGVYTFVVLGDDAAAGCVITDTLVLTVNSNPIVIANLDVLTICAGESVQLNVSAPDAPTSYLTSNATDPDDEEISNVTFGSINNSSTCSTTGGPGSTLNQYSDFTALAPAVVAPGQTVPYSVTQTSCGGAFGNRTAIFIDFNRDGDFLDAGENPVLTATVTGNNTASGYIVITGNVSYGKTRMGVIVVETTGVINSTGTYTWGETEDYTIEIGNANPLSFVWTPAAGLTNPNIANPIATPLVNTIYYITGTDGNTGCSSVDSVDITVLPVLNAPTTNNSAHCGSQIPTASVDPVVGATAYYWYDAAVGGNILQADPSLTFLAPVGTTTTMYVAAFDGTCYSSRSAITITVATPPAITAQSSDSTLCAGVNTINLDEILLNYPSYTWTSDAGGNLNSTSGSSVTASPSAPGIYNYIVEGTDGVCTNRDTVTVEVFNLPAVLSINIADTTLCEGQSTSVVANAIPSSVTSGPQTPPSGYLTSFANNTIDEDINGVTIEYFE
ncbi:MAG: lamin tail domain-containing protein [Bacteroidetes bacterium]|nr:lamin tail domain-containing protein [Bacteroidota bacterium]